MPFVCSKQQMIKYIFLIVFSCSLSHFWKIYWRASCENPFSCALCFSLVLIHIPIRRLAYSTFGHTHISTYTPSNAPICKFSQLKIYFQCVCSLHGDAQKGLQIGFECFCVCVFFMFANRRAPTNRQNFLINLLIAINFQSLRRWIDWNWASAPSNTHTRRKGRKSNSRSRGVVQRFFFIAVAKVQTTWLLPVTQR